MPKIDDIPATWITEEVTLVASATCVGCKRTIQVVEKLEGHAVRTGNHTQTAKYWLDSMNSALRSTLLRREWRKQDSGWHCAHCIASQVDQRANEVDQSGDEKTITLSLQDR